MSIIDKDVLTCVEPAVGILSTSKYSWFVGVVVADLVEQTPQRLTSA